jgi:diketogulonate reductase-like aldo/keto reductase
MQRLHSSRSRGSWRENRSSCQIPGTRNVGHLRENLGALDVQLTPADLAALDAEFSKLAVHGGRMNEMQMRAVERAG